MNTYNTVTRKIKMALVFLVAALSIYVPSAFASAGEMPSLVRTHWSEAGYRPGQYRYHRATGFYPAAVPDRPGNRFQENPEQRQSYYCFRLTAVPVNHSFWHGCS